MRRTHDLRRHERGNTLLLVLMISVLAVFTAMGVMALSHAFAKTGHSLNTNNILRYAGEAGIERVRFHLNEVEGTTNDWLTNKVTGTQPALTMNIGQALVEISFEEIGTNQYRADAVASLEGQSITTSLEFYYEVTGTTTSPLNQFSKYVFFTNGSGTWAGGIVGGYAHTNGSFTWRYSLSAQGRQTHMKAVTAANNFYTSNDTGTWTQADWDAMFPDSTVKAESQSNIGNIDMPSYSDIDSDLRPIAQSGPAERYVSTDSSAYSSLNSVDKVDVRFSHDPATGQTTATVTAYETTATTSWELVQVAYSGSSYYGIRKETKTSDPASVDPNQEYYWVETDWIYDYSVSSWVYDPGYYQYDGSTYNAASDNYVYAYGWDQVTTMEVTDSVSQSFAVPTDGSPVLIFTDAPVDVAGDLYGQVTVATSYKDTNSSSNSWGITTQDVPAVNISDDVIVVDQAGNPKFWVYDSSGNPVDQASDTNYANIGTSSTNMENMTSTWDGTNYIYKKNPNYNPDVDPVIGLLSNGDIRYEDGDDAKKNTIMNAATYVADQYSRFYASFREMNYNVAGLPSRVSPSTPYLSWGSSAGTYGFGKAKIRLYDDDFLVTPPPFWIKMTTEEGEVQWTQGARYVQQ